MGIMSVAKNAAQNTEENKIDWVNGVANMVNNFVSNMNQGTGLSETEKVYKDMQTESNELYDQQIAASEQREQELLQQQQDRTDFTLQKIEQQKEQAQKDYDKEQTAAYVDWQKQSNPYGVNAEKMAANGLTGTGYSESAQVAMYTAYQNRVATARASFELTKQDFNNAITEAMLQNNSLLAEIAYKAQQERLTLNMQKFQQNNAYLLAMLELKQNATVNNTENAVVSGKVNPDETGNEGDTYDWKNSPLYTIGKAANDVYRAANGLYPNNAYEPEYTTNEDETMRSIRRLGLGDLTPEQLYKLVAVGAVKQYEENGVTKFKKNHKFTGKIGGMADALMKQIISG